MTAQPNKIKQLQKEGSFTLIETVIALALITFLIMQVSAVQGNSIVFSDYGRNITQATQLARRVMSQIDYFASTKSFKDLQQNVVDQKFEDVDEYSYSVEVKEWKFPLTKLLTGSFGGKEEGQEEKEDQKDAAAQQSGTPSPDMIEDAIKMIFGDEPIFMTAKVEVSWAEGAQRNSAVLTHLLTNQTKLDEFIATLKPEYDRATKPAVKPGTPAVNPYGAPGSNSTPGSPTTGGVNSTPPATNPNTTPVEP